MTSHGKVRKTLSLDADLVAVYDLDGNLSAAVNSVLRRDLESRRRSEALSSWLEELSESRGPVDSAEVEAAAEALG